MDPVESDIRGMVFSQLPAGKITPISIFWTPIEKDPANSPFRIDRCPAGADVKPVCGMRARQQLNELVQHGRCFLLLQNRSKRDRRSRPHF